MAAVARLSQAVSTVARLSQAASTIYPSSYLLIDVKTISLQAWLTTLILLYLFYVARDVEHYGRSQSSSAVR